MDEFNDDSKMEKGNNGEGKSIKEMGEKHTEISPSKAGVARARALLVQLSIIPIKVACSNYAIT